MVSSPAGRNEAQAKLWSMIKKIKVAMMTSWDGTRAPCMGIRRSLRAKLYFFTRHNSGKTDEIGHFDKLNLAYVDIDDNMFVSIAGRGRLSYDRERMRKYWSPMVGAWFPKGLDDPQLALIEVDVDSAQYWDSTSSSTRYLWEVAAANLTGREPNLGESAKLDLNARS